LISARVSFALAWVFAGNGLLSYFSFGSFFYKGITFSSLSISSVIRFTFKLTYFVGSSGS